MLLDHHSLVLQAGRLAVLLALLGGLCGRAGAQDNYEIQVYGADLVPPRHTMFELHSNYTVHGSTRVVDGVLPTQDQIHETLEITHGFNEWFETGFYVFTSAQHAQGWDWVGDHIRPRFAVPERFKWPVGFSLSFELGYQRPQFSTDTWTLEIRPIVDKKLGRWYLAVNPALDRSFKGQTAGRGFVFSPAVKVSYDVTRKVALGVEYYSSLGPFFGWDPTRLQQHQIVPTVDLDMGPDWEFNFGVAFGLTPGTDSLIYKLILGRRVSF